MNARAAPPPAAEPPPRGSLSAIGAGAVIALAAVVACNKVWDSDVTWHLKSGQWMLQHRQVLRQDPFSAEDTSAPNSGRWINVHWGFQLLLAGAHQLGGFAGLVILKMVLFAGTMAVFANWLRGRISPAWLMLVGLWLILGVEARVRERPEIVTFLLLMITLAVTESVRRGAPVGRLWWLVPVNLLWVNMHGLFIVGVAACWAAVAGAFLDRLLGRQPAGGLASVPALAPCAVSAGVCLVNPWGVETVLHPLLLLTRVSGQEKMYSYGIQEAQPTYNLNPMQSIPVLLALLMALAVLAVFLGLALLEAARAGNRRLPAGHVLWLFMFLVPAVMAVRNLALFLVPAGFLLAVDGGELMGVVAQARPNWRKAGAPAAAVMLALITLAAGGYASEAVYRWQRRPANQFGLGLADGVHPVAMAKWLGQVNLDGDVMPLDFGEGGTFIYYSYPRRKVYMDGRLEVHSTRRFERLFEYRTKMLSSSQAADPVETPLPPSVRFIVVWAGESKTIEALSNCPRFKLLYVDRGAVCFGRLPLEGEKVAWPREQSLPPANLEQFDRPLDLRGGTLLPNVPTARHWYRQNISPAHWEMGALFYNLGMDDLAIRYLTAADRLGLQDPVTRIGFLAQAHQRRSEYYPIEPDPDLPVDPNLSRALALYQRLDLENLADFWRQTFALVRVRALVKGLQIDAADSAMRRYLENLPIPQRWQPTAEEIAVRDSVKAVCEAAQARQRSLQLSSLGPEERALMLLGKDIGCIDGAVAVLESAGELPPRGRMLLGDLYLRKGQTGAAAKVYGAMAGQEKGPLILMRLGLCAWAEGDFTRAWERLRQACASGQPEPVVYLALLQEQLGHYAAAAETAARYAPSADQTGHENGVRLLARVKARLKVRGFEAAAPGPRSLSP